MTLKEYYYSDFRRDVNRLPLKHDEIGECKYFGENLDSFENPWQDVKEDLAKVGSSSNERFIASLLSVVSIDMMLHQNFFLTTYREGRPDETVPEKKKEMYKQWEKKSIYPKFGRTCMGSSWSRNPLYILKCSEEAQVIDKEKMLAIIPELVALIQAELKEAVEMFFREGNRTAEEILNNWVGKDSSFTDERVNCTSVEAFRKQLTESLAI